MIGGTPMFQGQEATAVVTLYQALGGGWPVSPADSLTQH
jgi:hypothetical protein